MARRRELLSGIVLTSISISGCLSPSDQSRTARISDISLLTLYNETVRLDLRILKDGDLVLEESYTLTSETGSEGNPAPVIEQSWMDEPGRFELTVEASTMDEPVSREIPNRGEGCYAVIVRVLSDGRVDVPMDAESSGC